MVQRTTTTGSDVLYTLGEDYLQLAIIGAVIYIG